ncbi:hypothetical protein K144316041_18420 [Clostridium tetani]|uniref:DrmE family protein n=1 Tax=Clostridium tetani TaxID=1513 RepID=UPI00295371CC|nr:DrmE family protein [Clostridium tetani]BDR73134.1 hypothetical protein K144316041_18420 [Clostridium tetani]
MKKLLLGKILKDNIFFKNKLLNIDQYNLENIEIIQQMFENKNKLNLLITPNKETTEILTLIILGINLYIKNLHNDQNNILEYLNIGDIVVYKGKKVKYMGVECKCGKNKIKLAHAGDNDNIWIRLEDHYKISIYNGNSEKLSIMSEKKSSKKNSKHILADMLGLDLEELGGIIKEQMVLVCPNKQELEDLLNNIKIKVKDKRYYFTEIFPCKYYSNVDNYVDFKGNKIKLKEILIFTSNLGVATELIQENKERSNLLLLSEDTYVNEIGGELDFLLSRKKLKKVYLLNTFSKFSSLEQIVKSEAIITIYAWTKSVFQNKLNKNFLDYRCLNDKKIYIFLNRKLNNKVIEEYKDISTNLLKLKLNLLDLSKEDFYCNDKQVFLIAAYGLLNIFEKIIVPIKEYDEFIIRNELNKYAVGKLMEKLVEVLQKNKLYKDVYKVLEGIIQIIKELNEMLYYKNPKLEYIKSLNLGYCDLIICSNSIEKCILEKYEFIKNNLIMIECIRKYNFNDNLRRIIFTCINNTNNINQLYCYNALNIINLLYPSEVAKYNAKVNKFNRVYKLVEENNSLEKTNKVETLPRIKIDCNKFIKNDIIDDEQVLEEEIENNIYNDIKCSNHIRNFEYSLDIEELLNMSFEQSEFNGYLNSEYNSGYAKKYVKFKDGTYSLLSEFYKCKCIDNVNYKIIEKNINLLEIGDNLIFVRDKTEDEITELFHKIMCSEKFKSKYYKHYYNMKYWRNIVKKYIDKYFEDYSLVAKELLLHGINRSEQAIRTWVLDENIIGPREKEVYQAIAKIVNDYYFLENWEEIYESCNLIRSLKTKLKSNFKDMVIKSVINEKVQGIFESLVYDVLGDLKQYAEIKDIMEIEEVSKNVSINKINCVWGDK